MRTFSFHAFIAALLFLGSFMYGCSNSVTPNPDTALIIDSLGAPKLGSTLIFSYATQSIQTDTTTSTRTLEFTVDRTHRTLDSMRNVTWWGGPTKDSYFAINYLSNAIRCRPAEFIWGSTLTRYTTFDLSTEPTSLREIFRLDSINMHLDTSNSGFTLRDSLRSLGVEKVKVAGTSFRTIHLQETTRVWYTSQSLNTYQVVTDYWYAPSIGFFVMEEQNDLYHGSRSHFELIAYVFP